MSGSGGREGLALPQITFSVSIYCTLVTRLHCTLFTSPVFTAHSSDSSHDVLLDHVVVHSWDDAVAVKATVSGRTTERVSVRRSVLSTRKSAMKIGTESLADFTNITFDTV
jgi:hypothetical protein